MLVNWISMKHYMKRTKFNIIIQEKSTIGWNFVVTAVSINMKSDNI